MKQTFGLYACLGQNDSKSLSSFLNKKRPSSYQCIDSFLLKRVVLSAVKSATWDKSKQFLKKLHWSLRLKIISYFALRDKKRNLKLCLFC